MKKIIALILSVLMLLTFAACGNAGGGVDEEVTVGTTLRDAFKENNDGTAEEIANSLITNEIIPFMPAVMPVEEGYLNGFDNEIKGFSSGAMFAPMIGTIPFVGYIFELEDGADVDAFMTTLKDNANLRFNICTEAEEMIVEKEGNKVFFLMSPKSFEEAEDVGDGEVAGDENQLPAEDGITLEQQIQGTAKFYAVPSF